MVLRQRSTHQGTLGLLRFPALAQPLDRDRSEVVDALGPGGLRRAERDSDGCRVRDATSNLCGGGIEIEVPPRETEHLARSPALAEQQRDGRTEPEWFGCANERLRLIGCERSADVHALGLRGLHEIERAGGDQARP